MASSSLYLAVSVAFGGLGALSVANLFVPPGVVLVPVAQDARTVQVDLAGRDTAILRCVDGQVERMSVSTFAGDLVEGASCSVPPNSSPAVVQNLAIIFEAADTPSVWQCQRTRPNSDDLNGCVKLGALHGPASSFERLVVNLAPMPLYLITPEDMRIAMRSGS